MGRNQKFVGPNSKVRPAETKGSLTKGRVPYSSRSPNDPLTGKSRESLGPRVGDIPRFSRNFSIGSTGIVRYEPDRNKELEITTSPKTPETASPETTETTAPATVAFVPPAKINGAAVSYSAYLRARGFDISAAEAEFFWKNEDEWRYSPERKAEIEAAKFVREAADAKRKADREAKKLAAAERNREAVTAAAKRLGLIP